ncbi:MAG: hypothetical protein OEZ22_00935 [Spirochaetia bacterium]|nr:hypothetical protein [Spirochaetia bacterium]
MYNNKNQKYFISANKIIFLFLFVLFTKNNFSIEFENSEFFTVVENLYESEFLTLDGKFVKSRLYKNKNLKNNNLIVLYPDGSSRDVLRKNVSKNISEFNSVLTLPSREEEGTKFLGRNFEIFKKLSLEYRPRFYRVYYTGDILWDYTAHQTFLQEAQKKTNLNKKTAIIPAFSVNVIIKNPQFIKADFDSYVFISPAEILLENEAAFLKNKKNILWAGSEYQSEIIKKLTEKYGGVKIIYKQAGSGYNMFMRNQSILSDVLQWINKN